MAAQGTPATAVLAREQVPHTLHRYEVPVDTPDYGRAVAAALDLPPERVFKTLVADAGGELTVAVVPVAGELDRKALAAAVGARRAAVADRAVAERATGYVRGGISPLGQRHRLPTVLDESVSRFETVYVSAGRRCWGWSATPPRSRRTGSTPARWRAGSTPPPSPASWASPSRSRRSTWPRATRSGCGRTGASTSGTARTGSWPVPPRSECTRSARSSTPTPTRPGPALPSRPSPTCPPTCRAGEVPG